MTGYTWVIDPIDGTANFVKGIPAWCVVIACAKDGVTVTGVIHDPSTGETFYGSKGGGAFLNGKPIRASSSKSLGDGSLGVGFSNRRELANVPGLIKDLLDRGGIFFRNASGALMLAYVASGRLIGYVEEHMNAWDCSPACCWSRKPAAGSSRRIRRRCSKRVRSSSPAGPSVRRDSRALQEGLRAEIRADNQALIRTGPRAGKPKPTDWPGSKGASTSGDITKALPSSVETTNSRWLPT